MQSGSALSRVLAQKCAKPVRAEEHSFRALGFCQTIAIDHDLVARRELCFLFVKTSFFQHADRKPGALQYPNLSIRAEQVRNAMARVGESEMAGGVKRAVEDSRV